LGSATESGLNKVVNPWYRPEWKDIGLGISVPVGESSLPSWAGAALGGLVQEKSGSAAQNKIDNLRK
jgi:filamentous hemagglutinin